MAFGFKATVLGTNTDIATSTEAWSTLDALSDEVHYEFDLLGINRSLNIDNENSLTLNGREISTQKIIRENYRLDLKDILFIQQTPTATYTANRFFEDLLLKKFHFIL